MPVRLPVRILPLVLAPAALFAFSAGAQSPAQPPAQPATASTPPAQLNVPATLPDPSRTVYRQVTKDGRVIYSDKQVPGAKIEETLVVDPPIRGNTWAAGNGAPPKIPPQTRTTEVKKVNVVPPAGQQPTRTDAESEVIRAEMLLEEARKRKEAGAEPLPGERTGTVSGYTRLNEKYLQRQQALDRGVADAEQALRRAIAERDALPPGR